MAFSFMDLFPDSPAAVKASEGARQILEGQYKQAMDAVGLENSILNSANAKIQFDEQQRQKPLAQTVEAIKLLQGLNVPTMNTQGLDFTDINAVIEFLKSQPVQTNMHVDMAKIKAQEESAIAKATAMAGNKTDDFETRDAARARREQENQERKAALAEAAKIKEDFGDKSPKTEQKKKALIRRYNSLVEMGNMAASRAIWQMYSDTFIESGIAAPNGAAKTQQTQAPPSNKPKTYTSKGGKKYLIYPDGRIEGQ